MKINLRSASSTGKAEKIVQLKGSYKVKPHSWKDFEDAKWIIHRNQDNQEVLDLVNSSPVKVIPRKDLGKNFEPYTLKDLNSRSLDPRVKRIVKAMKDGTPLPAALATKAPDGTIDVVDGFTRSGVAIGLGLKPVARMIDLKALEKLEKKYNRLGKMKGKK